jgi:hypothetical protein
MENKFNKTLSKSDFSLLGISNSYLNETLPSDAPTGTIPIFSIKQMIDGYVNFKVIYNLVKNKVTLNKCLLHTLNINKYGVALFTYNGTTKGVMIKTTLNGNFAYPNYNCIDGTTNILSNSILASSTGIPVITTQCGVSNPQNDYARYQSNDDGPIYYFIPASTTTGSNSYIGLGVLSNCWTHTANPTDTPANRWIIGRRYSINKAYNYIIEITPDQSLDYKYKYKIYTYNTAGGLMGNPASVSMNSTREDYTIIDGGYQTGYRVNATSVNNRLSGNFFDIINGFKGYNGSNNACNVDGRACVAFYCQQKYSYGTGSTNGYYNFHIAPLKNSSSSGINSTLDAYEYENRPFGLYRNITFVDLSRFSIIGATLRNNSLIVYPGEVTLNSYVNGYSNVKLNNTDIYRLDDKITNNNTTLNSFNNLIKVTKSPLLSNGGRNLYIMLTPPESSIKVYCNHMNNYTTGEWTLGAATMPDNRGLKLIGTLTSSYYYIIETWCDTSNTYAKMYTYNGTSGNCTDVGATMKALTV